MSKEFSVPVSTSPKPAGIASYLRIGTQSTTHPTVAAQTGFVWPGLHNLRITVPLALLVALVFALVYGGTSFITGLHVWRLSLYTQAELALPFQPEWALIYLSLNLMFVLILFIFPRWQDALPLFATFIIEILVAAPFFLLLPQSDGFTHPDANGLDHYAFALADTMNLSHNYLPSLHVTFAATMALAFWPRFGWKGRTLFIAWALAIAASTLLLHQHYLIDVAAGFLLAALAMRFIYPRTASKAFLAHIEIEAICLREFYYFSRRHLRYMLTGFWLYLYSLWHRGEEARLLRAAYCLVQHLDDVLDGDRVIQESPPLHAQRLLTTMEAEFSAETRAQAPHEDEVYGDFGDDREADGLTILARYVARVSRNYESKPGEFRQNFRALLDLLLFDWQRRQTRQLLSASELAEHHRNTFIYSTNLTLLLLRSRLRAEDAIDVIAALSWCSPIRDLRADWDKGLINVPREVLEQAEAQCGDPLDFDALQATPAFQGWLQYEFEQAQLHLRQAEARLSQLPHDPGTLVLKRLTRALQHYASRYARKVPGAK